MAGQVTRKPIASAVQTAVLVKSRRRCCACFGLDRDTGLKNGQIAHVDQNSTNNKEDNLVFLCLNHHDQYDSRTRQSKNLTEAEIRHFLGEFTQVIQNTLQQPVFFGSAKTDPVSGIEGPYTRVEGSSAEISLTALPVSPDRFHVAGFALWGERNELGPNTGELDFSTNLVANRLELIGSSHNPDYKLTISVSKDRLEVDEENFYSLYGEGLIL